MAQKGLVFGILPAAFFAAAIASARGSHGGHNISTSGGGREGITRCGQWSVEFGNRDASFSEEHLTIPASEASPLVASPSENGGITVIGSDGRDFEVTVCKAVPDDEPKLLDRIRLERKRGRLSVEGPEDADWVAHLIIRAPKNSAIELDTHNGPVSVADFIGRATITSENGPVTLRRSSGQLDVWTTNGPIHFEGGSGKVRLEAENGPLSVHLQNTSWQGGELEGRTQNGPVHLDIAENYSSGVRVETSGHSPVHCSVEACRRARRNWDDDGKTIAFGPEQAVVRLSTHNGPVSIAEKD